MINKIHNLFVGILFNLVCLTALAQQKPNVILVYVDDLGYGDLSCYGATKLKTPNLDKLAKGGVRFTNAHSTSATCTPSRFAMMTGNYPWRQSGTGILPGDASLIVPTNKTTLPKVFKNAGYQTAIIGKWHLGIGDSVAKNWNGELKPGPNETGFDYSFIFPATADRVPSVFVENHRVVALDTSDPIAVSYTTKIGNEPTGAEHPELLKMVSMPNHGHNQTIVNGIGRIGYMTGGKMARWTDEEMPLTFLEKAKQYIVDNRNNPFFLYYALTEPHVPRVPSTMFKGKSGLGFRGDAILQLDWAVGEIIKQLEVLNLQKNTIIIFSSDNGPVLDDGYMDGAVTQLNGHTLWGPLRGGKYSMLEAGTRVPFILSWPGKVNAGVSDALVCQIDLIRSFAGFFHQRLQNGEANDSEDLMNVLLGKSKVGRASLIVQGADLSLIQGNENKAGTSDKKTTSTLALIKNNWKYIPANNGPANTNPKLTNIETGNSTVPQLYNLKEDIGERNNLAEKYPEKLKEMVQLMEKIKRVKL